MSMLPARRNGAAEAPETVDAVEWREIDPRDRRDRGELLFDWDC